MSSSGGELKKFFLKKKCVKANIPAEKLTEFLLTCVSVYIIYRFFALKFNWERKKKDFYKHVHDISVLITLATVSFYLGGYEDTFPNKYMITSMVIGALIFGLLGELPFMKNSLATMDTWGREARFVYTAGLIITIIIGLIHAYNSIICDKSYSYIASFGAVILYIVFVLKTKGNQSVHIHHWQIFWILSFFTRFDTTFSQIAAGLTMGIFINGISQYSPDGFYDT